MFIFLFLNILKFGQHDLLALKARQSTSLFCLIYTLPGHTAITLVSFSSLFNKTPQDGEA